MSLLAIFLSGALFGAGLTLSGMVDPMKVQNFLDLAGLWDPSLILVMAGGLIVTFLGYRLAWRRRRPIFAERFALPSASRIDLPLIAGAALFGVGWGLGGLCPGPAIAGLVFGWPETWIFLMAMTAGMLAVRFLDSTRKPKEAAP